MRSRILLFAGLIGTLHLGTGLGTPPLLAADSIRIVRVSPSSGELAGWTRGAPMNSGNSIEVTVEYNLESLESASVFANIVAPKTGSYQMPARASDGSGRITHRIAVMCSDDDPPVISGMTLRGVIVERVGVAHLVDVDQSIPHTIRCSGTSGPRIAKPPAAALPPISPQKPLPGVKGQRCPDLTALSLTARILSRSSKQSETEGEVRITGRVRNVGSADYMSRSGQQELQLWETVAGRPPRLVRSKPFESLRRGQQIAINHRTNWSTAVEWPPDYTLKISFDPDIGNDGNKANDDCGSTNNEKKLTGARINRLF